MTDRELLVALLRAVHPQETRIVGSSSLKDIADGLKPSEADIPGDRMDFESIIRILANSATILTAVIKAGGYLRRTLKRQPTVQELGLHLEQSSIPAQPLIVLEIIATTNAKQPE